MFLTLIVTMPCLIRAGLSAVAILDNIFDIFKRDSHLRRAVLWYSLVIKS